MMRLWYKLWYGFEMTLAYLACGMGDNLAAANHERMADVAWKKWWSEGVQ